MNASRCERTVKRRKQKKERGIGNENSILKMHILIKINQSIDLKVEKRERERDEMK